MNSVTENKHDVVEMGETEGDGGADVINVLRRFHYGEPAAAAHTTKPAGAVLPALLNPYRDASAIRYQYPLYLLPPDGTTHSVLAKPASEYLSDALEALAPDAGEAVDLAKKLMADRYLQ